MYYLLNMFSNLYIILVYENMFIPPIKTTEVKSVDMP